MKSFHLLIAGLCFYIPSMSQSAPPDDNETLVQKIFETKNDEDFKFYMGGGRYSSFKYYLRNDSLWFAEASPYTAVIPLSNIDFERKSYFLESSLWKTETGDKCIEVPLYAIKGKKFGKEFEIEAFKLLDDEEIDFANLILPNKAFAEVLIKYLKVHRP
jgi:hypothetical protein